MPEPPTTRTRSGPRSPARALLAVVYGVLLVTAVGLIAYGGSTGRDVLLAVGVVSATIVVASAPIAFLLLAIARGSRGNGGDRVEQLLRQIHEHGMLSDGAKRVLFRERELAMLRAAIEADVAEGKYDVGLTLCDEMADVFGYREEAETFRAQILQARRERYEVEVESALVGLDELLAGRDWGRVHQEAARIRRLYGDSHRVNEIDRRILQARDEHKAELEGKFLEAVRRDDVEGAMEMLKHLDRYLDQDEAVRLTEVAQGVVARHRENLGVQFKMAVNDRRWGESVRIGEELIEEFPNTKMAEEVRSMIDVLRTRASQTAMTSPEG
jgi:hypothetical protein